MPVQAQRGGRDAAPPTHNLASRRERRCIHYTGGWVCLRTGLEGKENLAPPDFDPRDIRKMRRYNYREGICKIHAAEVSVLLGMTPGHRATRSRRSPTTCLYRNFANPFPSDATSYFRRNET